MKHISLPATLLAFLILFSCGKKQEAEAPVAPVEKKPVVKVFKPHPNGKVTKEQVESWNKANPHLNQLIITYRDSFDLKDTTAYLSQKESYSKEQDRICGEAGFIGKFTEYSWVKQNITNTINAPLLDSMGMK